MAEQRQMHLPDGEYFRLIDRRDEFDVLTGRQIRLPGMEEGSALFDQYDGDPEQSQKLSQARLQRRRELDPTRPPTYVAPSLFRDRRFPFNPSLLSDLSYFYGSAPRHEIHYDGLRDFANEPTLDASGTWRPMTGTYDLVSTEWMSAIESLDTGVHEFFPHLVRFADASLKEVFISRDANGIDFIDRDSGKVGVRDVNARYGSAYSSRLPVRPSPIQDRHWFRDKRSEQVFVTRTLALRLLPLLPVVAVAVEPNQPNLVRFEPVDLVATDAGYA